MAGVLVLVALVVASCASEPEPPSGPGARSPEAAASEFFERIRDHDFETVYDRASGPFRGVNSREETLTRLEELGDFGRLEEVRPTGEPQVAGPEGGRTATIGYEAAFALGAGTFELTLREEAESAAWRLDHYAFDVRTTTAAPPYARSPEGADALAERFMFLWQKRRYDELAEAMRIGDDPDKVPDFFKQLEGAGDVLTVERSLYQADKGSNVKAEYNLEFDNGSGYITFILVPEGDRWSIGKVTYDVERLKQDRGPEV